MTASTESTSARREKFRRNLAALKERGIAYKLAHSGHSKKAVIIVGDVAFDLWPSTGSWRQRALCEPGFFWADPNSTTGKDIASLLAVITVYQETRGSAPRTNLRGDCVPVQPVGVGGVVKVDVDLVETVRDR